MISNDHFWGRKRCLGPSNVMFDGEIVKKKFPLKKNFGLRKYLVQDRVQDKVQDKVGLRKFSPKNFFLQKALKCYVWWRNCEKKISL